MWCEKSTTTLRANYLINSKDKNKKKSMKRMKILFKILHVCLSLDFGFVKYQSVKKNIGVKLLTMTLCLIITSMCITAFYLYMTSTQAMWYSFFCLEYVSYVTVLIFSNSEKTFYVLQTNLYALDSRIGIDSDSYKLDIFMAISCLNIIIFRIAIALGYCAMYPENCVDIPFVNIMNFIPWFSNDIVLVVYFFTFYSIYRRLKKFTDFLKNTSNIFYCHQIYKTVVDFSENVKETFDAVFIVSIIFNTPEFLASVFLTLRQLKTDPNSGSTSSIGGYFTTTQSLFVIFSPVFSAGLLASQVQKIKLILHDKLLMEKNREQASYTKRFISYIEARPLRFTVCKVIPLDWNLPFMVLNLCITYLIVIIQFTHLY